MKVLLALDDSRFSEAVMGGLVARFDPGKTEVRVVSVVEPIAYSNPPQMAPGYVPELKEQTEKARALVDATSQKLRAAGFRVTAAVETGDAREKILDAAEAWPADLILLGSHGRRGIRRFLLGSVAESVARHAHCSVEIVRAPVK
ncbi:MAG TPA: universal stress protein [Candidatus Acidoferrales bacterium]|nr:universal stress protein [Candidatus Acidoferrales bacterium]